MKKLALILISLFLLAACSSPNPAKDNYSVDQDENYKYYSYGEAFTLQTNKKFNEVKIQESSLQNQDALLPIYSFERKDGKNIFPADPVLLSFNIPEANRGEDLTIVQVLEINDKQIFRKLDSALSNDGSTLTAELKHFSNYTITRDRYGNVEIPQEVKDKLVELSQNPPEGAVEFFGEITYISNNAGATDWEAFNVHKGCKSKQNGGWEVESVKVSNGEHDGDCVYDPVTDQQTCEQGNSLYDTWNISYQWGYEIDPAGNCSLYHGEIEILETGASQALSHPLGHFTASTTEAKGKFELTVDNRASTVNQDFIGDMEGNIYGQGKLNYDLNIRPESIGVVDAEGRSLTGIEEGLHIEGQSNYNDTEATETKLDFRIDGIPKDGERVLANPFMFRHGAEIASHKTVNYKQDLAAACPDFGADLMKDMPIVACQEMTYSLILQGLQSRYTGDFTETFFKFEMPADNDKWKEYEYRHNNMVDVLLRVKLTAQENPTPENLQESLKVKPEEIVGSSTNLGSLAGETETCGNDELDEDEECDDGNLMDGDGCSSQCLNEGDYGLNFDDQEFYEDNYL